MAKYHAQLMKDMGFKAPKPGPFSLLKPLDSACYSKPFTTAPTNRARSSFSSDDSEGGILHSSVSNWGNFEGQRVAHNQEVCEAVKQQVNMEVSAVELKSRTAATDAAAALLQGAPEGRSAAAVAAAGVKLANVDGRVGRKPSGELYLRSSSDELYTRQSSGDMPSGRSRELADIDVLAASVGATGVLPPQVPVRAAIGNPETQRRTSQPGSPASSADGGVATQASAPLLRMDTRGSTASAGPLFGPLSNASAPLPKLQAGGILKMANSAAMFEGGSSATMTPFGHRLVQQQGGMDRGVFLSGSNITGAHRRRMYNGSGVRTSGNGPKAPRRSPSCSFNLTYGATSQQHMQLNSRRKSDESSTSISVPSDDWCEVTSEPGPFISVPPGWGKGSSSAKQGVPCTVYEASTSCSTDEAEVSGAFVIGANALVPSRRPKVKGVMETNHSGLSKAGFPPLFKQQAAEQTKSKKSGKLLGLQLGRKISAGNSCSSSFSSDGSISGAKGIFASFTKAKTSRGLRPEMHGRTANGSRSSQRASDGKPLSSWPGSEGIQSATQYAKQDPLAPVRRLVMQLQEHAEMEQERFQREQGARATAACLGASLGDKQSSLKSAAASGGNGVGPRVRFAQDKPVSSSPSAASGGLGSGTSTFASSESSVEAIPAAAAAVTLTVSNKGSNRDAIHDIGPAALAGAAEQAMRVHKQGAAMSRLSGPAAAVAAALGPDSSEFQAIQEWMEWVNNGGSSTADRQCVVACRRSVDGAVLSSSSLASAGNNDGSERSSRKRASRHSRCNRGLEAFQPKTAAPLLSLQELQAVPSSQAEGNKSDALPVPPSGQHFYKRRESKSLDLGCQTPYMLSAQPSLPKTVLDVWIEHV
jgi:hypothetical protein